MFERLRHIGLQRRIMLFVVAGLSLMFGILAVLGLGAIDQATVLVFHERLSTAFTTAAILDRDLGEVAADAREEGEELGLTHDRSVAPGAARDLLDHFSTAPYTFFRVSRVWILDAETKLRDTAAIPPASASADLPPGAHDLIGSIQDEYVVGRALAPLAGGVAFATLAVELSDAADAPSALIDLESINATVDYVPGAYGGPPSASSAAVSGTSGGYHLEVVDPSGVAVLGIGSDEVPGETSRHYPKIQGLMSQGAAAALLHEPGPSDAFEAHVMAVVPLPSTPLYVVLEQPTDVALALPHQLQQRLFLTIILGFLAALTVAWVTTRHVVRPTEELTRAAGRMAGGDLDSPIDVRAEDEIALLAESLEAMRRQLSAAREVTERTQRQLEDRVTERTERLNQVLGQTIDAQEAERGRLARELHDETAQSLAALGIALDRARDALAGTPDAARRLIVEARDTAAHLLADTRRLIAGLRPSILDDLGLVPAIRWFAESTLSEHGVEWTVEADDEAPRLAGHLEVALYRIVQEAITNIARHAGAHHARITLGFEPRGVSLEVMDDGLGFDPSEPFVDTDERQGNHVGLIGMQERVRLLGGVMTIESSPGHGTSIAVQVPTGSEAA